MHRADIPLTALLLASLLSSCDASETNSPGAATPLPTNVRATTLVAGLDTPWDLVWGPDNFIWVSERGGRISRVDPRTGVRTTVGELQVRESGESGLMGIAFHPDFATTPFLYAAHSYSAAGLTRNRLVRMRYEAGALGPPQVLLDGIPGAGIHDGSRIVVGPDRLMYMTMGDASNPDLAQDRNSLAGKILRVTLDGHVQVHSYGHRNPQGIAWDEQGRMFATEHGPSGELGLCCHDELNRIEKGSFYGWPFRAGEVETGAGQPPAEPFDAASATMNESSELEAEAAPPCDDEKMAALARSMAAAPRVRASPTVDGARKRPAPSPLPVRKTRHERASLAWKAVPGFV